MQPIDRGIGQLVKFFVGQCLDEWLEDDDTLEKWESDTFSASDRRILLAQWCVPPPPLPCVQEYFACCWSYHRYSHHAAFLVLPTGSIACLRQVLQGV